MIIDTATALTRAAVCLVVIPVAIATVSASHAAVRRQTVIVKHAPVTSPGDVSEPSSARQNVIESKQYEQLLRTNATFRQTRMKKECGPISDPQLHQSCIASFEHYTR